MLFVDHRCHARECEGMTGAYRMVGKCINCGTEDILVMFTEQHEKQDSDCPVCKCRDEVKAFTMRLATPDEIPVA